MRNAFLPLLRKLSNVESKQGCAISFYFFPQPPQNKAHAEDRIRLKDVVRNAQRKAETEGKQPAIADLKRIEELSDQLAQSSEPVAIFACAEHGIWEQVSLPGQSGETRVVLNGRFHLRALAESPDRNILVVTADRVNIRFLRLSAGKLQQFDAIESDIPRKARTDGFAGYDAGHKERHVGHWEKVHFKEMAEKMRQLCEGPSFDAAVIICRSELRSEIEPLLHPYVNDKLLGYLDFDPSSADEATIRTQVVGMGRERQLGEEQALIREVMGEAQRDARGKVGLRAVLEALERGEVQTLVLGNGFAATVSECGNCGHLDHRNGRKCSVCAQPAREIDDLVDALTTRALRSSLEIAYVDDEAFRKAGNIGALLRFRSDQNTPAKLAG
jgi:peptide subunit release factor 1 (eRF1)